jgi:hypothetical protein
MILEREVYGFLSQHCKLERRDLVESQLLESLLQRRQVPQCLENDWIDGASAAAG